MYSDFTPGIGFRFILTLTRIKCIHQSINGGWVYLQYFNGKVQEMLKSVTIHVILFLKLKLLILNFQTLEL